MANKNTDPKHLVAADGSKPLLADSDQAASLVNALLALGVYRKAIVLDISDRRTDVLLECASVMVPGTDGAATTADYQTRFEAERANLSAAPVVEKAGLTFREVALSSPRLVLRDVRAAVKVAAK